jgi:hypothetical protein
VAIKRRVESSSADELPAAKLYLDELREIVEILTAPDSDGKSDEFVVKYRVRDLECDTIEELEQIGGKARNFAIEARVVDGYRTSRLRMRIYGTSLSLECPSSDYWVKQGKIKEIFEKNAIWWKNAARHLPWWWLLLAAPLDLALHVLFPAFMKGAVAHVIHGLLVVIFLVPWILHVFAGQSVVVLHYSHAHGLRRWFQEHGTQVLLVVIGVALKYLADWVWQHFRH